MKSLIVIITGMIGGLAAFGAQQAFVKLADYGVVSDCSPTPGQSVDDLIAQCGEPSQSYAASDTVIGQREMQFGDKIVGLNYGNVTYVLDI